MTGPYIGGNRMTYSIMHKKKDGHWYPWWQMTNLILQRFYNMSSALGTFLLVSFYKAGLGKLRPANWTRPTKAVWLDHHHLPHPACSHPPMPLAAATVVADGRGWSFQPGHQTGAGAAVPGPLTPHATDRWVGQPVWGPVIRPSPQTVCWLLF